MRRPQRSWPLGTPRLPGGSGCLATSGPGGIHLLNGLYDAKLDHVPVLAITGMQETSVLGTGYQQEVNLPALFADLAEYNQMVANPQQVLGLVDNAVRTAMTRRGVVHLCMPNDIQIAGADDDPYAHPAPALPRHGSTVLPRCFGVPDPEQVAAAAEVLNAAERPAILAGVGALGGPVRGLRARPSAGRTQMEALENPDRTPIASSTCREIWPPWPLGCPTRSPCSTPSPAGR